MRRERGRFCTHVIFVSSTCRLLYAQREQLRKELHFLVVHVRDVGGAYGKKMIFFIEHWRRDGLCGGILYPA